MFVAHFDFFHYAMNGEFSLKYADESEKCYGVAGMTICLYMYDADKWLNDVSLNRADIDSLGFTPDFNFLLSQASSPKAVWHSSLKRFNLTAALLISNVVCRCYLKHRIGLSRSLQQQMIDLLCDEATENCQLDSDEVEALYNDNLVRIDRAFRSQGVALAVERFVEHLSQLRSLSADHIRELLS